MIKRDQKGSKKNNQSQDGISITPNSDAQDENNKTSEKDEFYKKMHAMDALLFSTVGAAGTAGTGLIAAGASAHGNISNLSNNTVDKGLYWLDERMNRDTEDKSKDIQSTNSHTNTNTNTNNPKIEHSTLDASYESKNGDKTKVSVIDNSGQYELHKEQIKAETERQKQTFTHEENMKELETNAEKERALANLANKRADQDSANAMLGAGVAIMSVGVSVAAGMAIYKNNQKTKEIQAEEQKIATKERYVEELNNRKLAELEGDLNDYLRGDNISKEGLESRKRQIQNELNEISKLQLALATDGAKYRCRRLLAIIENKMIDIGLLDAKAKNESDRNEIERNNLLTQINNRMHNLSQDGVEINNVQVKIVDLETLINNYQNKYTTHPISHIIDRFNTIKEKQAIKESEKNEVERNNSLTQIKNIVTDLLQDGVAINHMKAKLPELKRLIDNYQNKYTAYPISDEIINGFKIIEEKSATNFAYSQNNMFM